MAGVSQPRRGDIFLVSFDPAVGSEIRKTRPALIVQNNIANEFSLVTIVAAITSKFGPKLRPTEAVVSTAGSGLSRGSVVLLNQIRTVDRIRLVKKLGSVDDLTLKRVDGCLKISFALVDF